MAWKISSLWMRHPRTTNEMRQYHPLARAKRRPKNLPSVYDDIWIRHGKNWKHTTKHRKQYMINLFDGTDHRFLSNFFPSVVVWNGVIHPTVEHAFQAAKTNDREMQDRIAQCETPGQAKRAGRKVELRPDWEEMKLGVMLELVHRKFTDISHLRAKLLATGNQNLVEGNTWGDTFWGCVDGVGENHLGRILMRVRDELRPI